jgi:glutaminase
MGFGAVGGFRACALSLPVVAAVKAAYETFTSLNEGRNADYIPALAKVPSNYFGIGLVAPQGKVSSAGGIGGVVAVVPRPGRGRKPASPL